MKLFRKGQLVAWLPLAATLLLLVAGCSESSADLQPGQGGAGAAGGGTASHGGAGGTAPEFSGSVRGKVVDEDGAALTQLAVTLCAEVCRIADTDDTGAFLFEGVGPAVQVLESIGYPGPDAAVSVLSYTRFFDLVAVAENETVVLERPYVMYRVDESRGPLTGPQDLTLAGGLQVAFSADRFGTEDNPLPAPARALHFGAVEIPSAQWPTIGLGGWTVLRAWSTAVWDLSAPDAFAVVAPHGRPDALPANTPVAFLVADYGYGFLEGKLFEEEAELSADGMALKTPATGGLDRSTLWLAVARLDN